MSLARYRSKRDFAQTAEPRAARRRRKTTVTSDRGAIIFVVQKHAARRLHYDFRLEIDGVLKSWAVPKGFPFAQGEKRLAMKVEDHPSEYGGFEGVIPEGNYGAGTVMVWDAGICQVLEEEPRVALRQGKLVLVLQGQKLKGQWTLVQMRGRQDGDKDPWLVIKTADDTSPISARAEDRSVLSGRSMKQIAAQADRTWQSNREQNVARSRRRRAPSRAAQRDS